VKGLSHGFDCGKCYLLDLLFVFSVVVSRFRILVVPASMVRILFSLVMPTVRCCVLPATIVRAGRTVTLTERRRDEKQKCNDYGRKRSQSHDVPSSIITQIRKRSLTHAALSALLGACLQYLQFLQAWQGSAPVHVAENTSSGI
jgi:hypothetical protein